MPTSGLPGSPEGSSWRQIACGSPSWVAEHGEPARAAPPGPRPPRGASRACEPGIQADGLLGLLARERRVEEVVGVREQAVLRLDASDARGRQLEACSGAAGVDDRDATRGRVRRLAQQRPGVLDPGGLRQQAPQHEVHGDAELAVAVARVIEDVERDGDAARRDADLAEDPRLGHRREARALDRRRPHEAALGRIGVPVPVLREPRALGALAAADDGALGEREQLGAPVERRDELGLEPRPAANASSSAASGACQRSTRSSTRSPNRRDVVERVPEVGEERQVGARQSAVRAASARPAARPRSRGSVASVRSVASAVSAGADMRAG